MRSLYLILLNLSLVWGRSESCADHCTASPRAREMGTVTVPRKASYRRRAVFCTACRVYNIRVFLPQRARGGRTCQRAGSTATVRWLKLLKFQTLCSADIATTPTPSMPSYCLVALEEII
jgi:hypothetical protein